MTLHSDTEEQCSSATLERALVDIARDRSRGVEASCLIRQVKVAGGMIAAAKVAARSESLALVFGRLLLSDDRDVRAFAVSVQYRYRIASVADALLAMRSCRAVGDKVSVAQLAEAISISIVNEGGSYLPELREFHDFPDARDALMGVYLRHDCEWVAQQLDSLLPAFPLSAVAVMAFGLSGMRQPDIQIVHRKLKPALAGLSTTISEAISDLFVQKSTLVFNQISLSR